MPSTRPRAPLTRDLVLTAAVSLADRDGLTGVTMRRLAEVLSVEAMSLYHHLPGKAGLLDGLVESVAREIDVEIGRVPAGAGWQRGLRQRCLAARMVMVRHPWAPALIASRPAIPPVLFLHFERTLATMIEGGLSYRLAHLAMHALGSMTLGFTQELFSPARGAGAEASPPEEQLTRMASALPHITAMVASEVHAHDGDTLGWCDSQAEFEFTLDLLLDGLERKRRSEGRAPRATHRARQG